MTHGRGLKFCQYFSSLALTVWDRQCLEDSEQKDDSINESVNHKGNCRTALATPALLKSLLQEVEVGLQAGVPPSYY